METSKILALVQRTAPTLLAEGDLLTVEFYRHLFSRHPELNNTFNIANQANGSQAHSLFNALVMFLSRFDQLEALGDDARRIAAKHTAFEVRPEHYPLVGASLLAVISRRLDEEATPEVMKAWELAYGRIAAVLMGEEAAMYEHQRTQPGGWHGFRPFVVERVYEEAHHVKSFYLVPQDGKPLATFQAGQYISLGFTVPHHPHGQIRPYSLSDRPNQPHYRITVKRAPRRSDTDSALLSAYMHEHLRPGSVLQVHAPTGECYLDPQAETPLVMLAGGMGITPFMAMIEQVLASPAPRQMLLVHAVRSRQYQPFAERLEQLAARNSALRLFTVYQRSPVPAGAEEAFPPAGHAHGLLLGEHLDELLTPVFAQADIYCCGPVGFMRHADGLLRQRGIQNCRYEMFGPTQELN